MPALFEAVLEGRKTFEIREDRDRGFQASDTVVLMEYDERRLATEDHQRFTGRQAEFRIGYVSAFGQAPGYVVFSLLPLERRRDGGEA
nr:DUF3850 domain-containing protein [uncultured Holophaga sp.]